MTDHPRFEDVYAELRRIAAARLACESPGQTLDATGLVHEAYLRVFAADPDRPFVDRTHLLATAAEVIRLILIDRARAKGRQKRAGDRTRLDLRRPVPVHDLPPDDLLDLTDALDALAAEDPRKAELVKLRFFGGLSVEEVADALGVSRATADRHWAYARAWLHARFSPAGE
ncbi:MAG: sigma-70 family RNA polymerase sigma factor [Gemmataceae bacterium]|nr:sigma-70 family RNA polymerase sigma factor [Gemmataceae bacterium]